MAHDEQWLTPRLQTAATLCNQTPAATESPLWLGVDLGTCDVVSMVVDREGQPVAVCLDWADVVRDGIVWDFFSARSPILVAISTRSSSNSVVVLAMRRLHFLQVRTRVFPSTCWSLPGWK